MIWLTWRQFRASARDGRRARAGRRHPGPTGPGLADEYATGIAACTAAAATARTSYDRFFDDHRLLFLGLTASCWPCPLSSGCSGARR